MVNNVTFLENVVSFNISVLSMDSVDQSKQETVDQFAGNNNMQDVLNTQLEVQNRLFIEMKRGNLYSSSYQITSTPTCEPFIDRFENLVAGWASTFDVITNNDISTCD
tara:strand:- start:617 stop:940 length:324 start_codon:yes stop_codon:yes gene_type:complete